MQPRRPGAGWAIAFWLLAACRPAPTAPAATAPPSIDTLPASAIPTETAVPDSVLMTPSAVPLPLPAAGRTYQQADGNRFVTGRGDLPALTPLDIPLAQRPAWVTALPAGQGILWAMVLDDGRTQAFWVEAGSAQEVPIRPERLPPGMPPLLRLTDGQPSFVLPPADFSPASHPIIINQSGDLAYIQPDGALVIQQGTHSTRLPLNALPDARLLLDELGRLLLLTDPTAVYPHGVLGDELEAGSLSLVETRPVPRLVTRIPMEPPYVIEGIAPLWVDWDGDGRREIIVTRSSQETGAQIVMYNEGGDLLASGPAIGLGFRWRHQLVVAPFASDGRLELVDVLTPHIGGTVEFYQWQGDALNIVAEIGGHTSHVIGSSNLDMALAGWLDDSGRASLLLPSQDRSQLSGIQHTADGANVAWGLPLDGILVTNLAAATTASGSVSIAAGRADGVLRVWQP